MKGILLAFVAIISLSLTAQPKKGAKDLAGFPADTLKAHPEWPALHTDDEVIRHLAYTLSYDDPHEQAAWVAYRLSASHAVKSFSRKNNFRPDPFVATVSAGPQDYARSGFDRGHLAPANDMTWSQGAMSESFYYSNMSPQYPSFNRGIWSKLEALVHGWAARYGEIWVVTGPVFTPYYDCAGQVAVPVSYFKVVMKTTPPYECIGFILPNAASSLPLDAFAMSVKEVEQRTGINFFPSITDKTARISEEALCKTCWAWKNPPKAKKTN